MKKFGKLVLTLFSVFAIFVAVDILSIENVFAKNIEDEYEQSLILMKELGVIERDMQYDADSEISREDFMVYVAKLIGVSEYESDTRYYKDVDMNSYGVWAINYFAENGILSRDEDNRFYPEDTVTLDQAYKILTSMLGYDMYADVNGGYPTGYRSAAAKADIMIKGNTEPSFKNIMTILYRAAQADIYSIRIDSNTTKFESNGETLLSHYRDIYYTEGCVNAIGGLTAFSDMAVGKNRIRIDNDIYELDFDVYKPDYLATYVKCFYTDSKDGMRVKCILKENSKEDLTVSIKDIEDISEYKLSYLDEREKVKKEKLDSMHWIYNGAPLSKNLSDTVSNLNKGYVILRDTDDDNEWDTVLIWDYKNFVLSGFDEKNEKFYNKTSDGGVISLNDADEVLIYDETKTAVETDEIQRNSVLSVAQSKDGSVLYIIVSTTEFNGKLSQVKTEPDAVIVNGSEYDVEKSYAEEFRNKKFSVGNVYNYKIDAFGNVAYVYDDGDSVGMKYGYILKSTVDDSGEKLIVKLLTQDDGVQTLYFADKVKIDGVRYKTVKSISEAFPNSTDGSLAQQIIRYDVSEDNKIKIVDTMTLNSQYETDDNSLTVVGDESFSWKWYRFDRIGICQRLKNKGISDTGKPFI